MKEFNITGTHISEYFKCKRQLSLKLNDLTFYKDSLNIEMGKIIEENSYKRRSDKWCNFDIGGAVVDYIDFKNKVVFETKKSSNGFDFYKYQLKYYLYLLNDNFSGIIEVPTERKKYNITLTNEDIILIEEAILFINELVKTKQIIKEKKKINFCKKCSFFNYCYI